MQLRSAAIGAAAALLLPVAAWRIVHAQAAQATIPFLQGISIAGYSGSLVSGLIRRADNSFVTLGYSTRQPYSLLTSTATVAELLSDGLKNLAARPLAPAGVGPQSQLVELADLDNNGSIGAAYGAGSIVTVYQLSPGILVQAAKSFTIGQDVNSVFFADFNGDHLPDLAVAYDGAAGAGGIAILLNKGGGAFSNPVTYATGIPATHFAVLDFNHDGHLDIAAAALGGSVAVILGKGDGTFGPPVTYPAPQSSGQSITAADVDGDGNPDLIVGGATGVLLGNGDGTFRPGTPLPAGAASSYVWVYAAGDLNGDGKIDLVYADIQNQVVVPLFGKGNGAFAAGQAYAVSQLPDSLILTDYNNDGRLDIVNGTGNAGLLGPGDQSGNIDILLNNGDGTFQGAPAYFALATPQSQSLGSTSATVAGFAVGNFGGKFPGLIAAGFDRGLTLYMGNGKGGFEAPQALSVEGGAAIAAGDFNGDGIADAAVSQGNSGVAILLGTPTGLGPATIIATGGVFPNAIVTGDFNGDGKTDLAIAGGSAGGSLAILKGNGDGTFQPVVTTPAGSNPTALLAGDINGDGNLDLVLTDSGGGAQGAIFVLLNTGGGAFQTPVNVFSGELPTCAIGDVNGDRKLDLVVAAQTGNGSTAASWLQGNGDGTFRPPVPIATSDSSDNALLVQDFNGDGHADLVIAHQDSGLSGGSAFLAGNGDGTFSAETPFFGPAAPTLLAAYDMNGDGKPDLIVGGLTLSVLIEKPSTNAKATVVSAANAASSTVAPGSLASVYGADLANSQAGATSLPLPTRFAGTSVSIQDSSGAVLEAPLLYVIPSQVNFQVPPGLASGTATANVTSGDGTQSIAHFEIAPVAPGLFTFNAGGLAAAYVMLYHADGSQTAEQIYSITGSGAVAAAPVSLGSPSDQAYLIAFGTGFAAAGTSGVTTLIGGTKATVTYAGPQGQFIGLDQANVKIPAPLAGKGKVNIQLTANGIAANVVNMIIQ